MANYRVGDIIRLARKAAGMSQEELAFRAGVATETISRIETGKHKITQNTYRKIMEQLNWSSERSYAICTSEELGILEEKKLLEDAENKFDFKKAGEYLDILKEKIEKDTVSQQFVMRTEAIQDLYAKGEIECAITKLENALKLTVEDYETYLECENYQENGYPFTEQEMLILMNIAGAYGDSGQHNKSECIYRMLLNSMNSGYIGGKTVTNLNLVVRRNYSRTLAFLEKYEEAIAVLKKTLEESVKEKYGLVIPAILYDITWNMNQINKIKNIEIYELEKIKRMKRQAYYIAAARNDVHVKNVIKDSYEMLFHEEIESNNLCD